MTTLHRLYDHGGQSPWLDNLKRAALNSGELEHLVKAGIRGVTSNPATTCRASAAWRRSSSVGSTRPSTPGSKRSVRRRRGPCGVRRRWPRPSSPTSSSARASPAPAGTAWRPAAPSCNVRCGRRHRPRTGGIRICCRRGAQATLRPTPLSKGYLTGVAEGAPIAVRFADVKR